MRGWWQRKKYVLTLLVFTGGLVIALIDRSSLGEYTAFATLLLATHHAADVTDKKLNGPQ